MKILFFLGFRNPFPGAAWTRIGLITDSLSQEGNSVVILGAFMPIGKANYRKYENLESSKKIRVYNFVPTLGLTYRIPVAFAFNFLSSLVFSLPLLLGSRSKVVVASLPPGDAGLGFVTASLLLKKKVIIDYRDEWEEEPYVASITSSKIVKKFYRFAIQRISIALYNQSLAVTTVSDSFQNSLQKKGIKNIFLIPNGADITSFRISNKTPHGGLRIIYLGWMGSYYDFNDLITALSLLKAKKITDVKLTLVGEGTKLDSILSLASKLGVNRCVEYAGVASGEKLVEMIGQSDVGLVTGLYSKGQLPVKFFEYCACGIPVIATVPEDSELGHLIKENKIGLTCMPNNAQLLSEAIERMYRDKGYRESAGYRARLLIEQRFDRRKNNQNFCRLILSLVANN